MQRILESYRNEILELNSRNFALLAEGPLEVLRQLQKQIDECIQRLEAGGHQSAVDEWVLGTQQLTCPNVTIKERRDR